MLIYVSGKYTGDIDANIAVATAVAVTLWELGHAVICPHANTAHFEDAGKITYEQFIAGDLAMIARCDALVMVPGWEDSKGARAEWAYATSLGLPIYVFPDVPQLHLTEQRCPEQCQAFAETVGKMYRTHLAKNNDYSPANILLTGEVGLATRLWDKIARILNLTGFVLRVEKGDFNKPIEAANEPMEDAYVDAAVYSVIGLLLRQGKWGK